MKLNLKAAKIDALLIADSIIYLSFGNLLPNNLTPVKVTKSFIKNLSKVTIANID